MPNRSFKWSLKSIMPALVLCALAAATSIHAGDAYLKVSDSGGDSSLTNSTGHNWTITGAPSAANEYYTSNFFVRTPLGTATTEFLGHSLTLQPPSGQSAPQRSILFKGGDGAITIINNLTNAGGIINCGGGNVMAIFTGNQMTVISSSTIQADQGSITVGYTNIYGSANLTNTGSSGVGNSGRNVIYTGDLTGFTGRLVVPGAFPDNLVLNGPNAVPGNPATFTANQIDLGAGTSLIDNYGVSLVNANGGITLSGAATINAAGVNGPTVISEPITGGFALTKAGVNTLTLSGSNSFTGGLTFNAGQINVNGANALGAGTLNINVAGAIIDNTSGGAISNANNNAIIISQSFGYLGTYDLDLGTNSVNNGSLAKTATVYAGTLTFGGAFTGAGQFTKDGSGTLRMRGASTGLGGGLVVNAGTLALTGGALITNTPNMSIASGAILDVSGLSSTFTLGASRSQSISNSTGTVNGSVVTAGAGASLSPDAPYVPGTLTFNNNLDMSAGGAVYLDLSSDYSSGNDQIVVGGNLTLSSADAIHINGYYGVLDQTADYVLFAVSGTTAMTTTPALVWDNSPPSNSGNFSVLKVGNNVVLHYSAGIPPTVTASISPDPSVHFQAVTITANVTQGSASIASVKVDLTPIGGSSAASLIQDGSQLPALVYTNTFTVGSGTQPGNPTLVVTVTDTSSPVALLGTYNLSMTVSSSSLTWDGGGANNNWSSATNWAGDVAPGLVGDNVTFAGTTRLAPDMEANYSVASVTFDGTAGAFTLGSSTGSTLTNSGNIFNNSTSAQTVNVRMALSSALTFNASSGPLTLNSNITLNGQLTLDGAANTTINGAISGIGGLTKTGTGTLALNGASSVSGSVWLKGGTTVIDSGASVTSSAWCSVGMSGSDTATLMLKGTGVFTNSNDFNVGDIDSTVGTVNIQDNAVLSVASLFIGSANNSGSTAMGTVNQSGGAVIQTSGAIGSFVIGGRNAASTGGVGVYNLSGGTLTATAPVRMSGYGSSTFNQSGGTFTSASTLGGINLQRFAGPGGTYNLNGGVAEFNNIDASVVSTDPTFNSVFNFNGGTLKPTSSAPIGGLFIPAHLTAANVRNGGAIIDTAGFSVSIAQPLQHSTLGGDNATDGGLTKNGGGILTLTGTNTYTGATTVSNGTLQVDGSIASATTVKAGATLGGNGTISNTVTIQSGGSIGAGASIGTLTITGNLTLNAGATNSAEVNGSTPANDVIVLGASVAYGGTLNIVTNGTFSAGQQFQLFSGAGATNTGNFASIAGSPGSGLAFSFTNGVLSVVTAGPSGPATLTNSVSGNTLSLSWPAGQGWTLQSQTNNLTAGLGANWVDVAGSTATNAAIITINPANPTVFYRLRN